MKKYSRVSHILNLIEKDDKVLDIGCTGGYQFVDPNSPLVEYSYSGDHTSFDEGDFYWLHAQLLNKTNNLIGIDITEEQVNYMQELGYNVYVKNAENFNLNDKFSKIIASEVIEHLFNVRDFLNCCKKHMNDKSELIITTPAAHSLLSFLYAFVKFPNTNSNKEHTHLYCLDSIKYTLSEAGLKIKKIDLVKDYRFVKRNLFYNLFFFLVVLFSPFLPKRLANNTIIVIATL